MQKKINGYGAVEHREGARKSMMPSHCERVRTPAQLNLEPERKAKIDSRQTWGVSRKMSGGTYTLGVNNLVHNKTYDGESLTVGFRAKTLGLNGVVQTVLDGHALSATYRGDGRRNKQNFAGSQAIILDFDNGLTLNQALKDEFLRKNSAFVHTTCNHRKNGKGDRFRVLFLLESPVYDCGDFEALLGYLLRRYREADHACKDASRAFLGNTEAQIPLRQEVVLTDAFVEEAIEDQRKFKAQQDLKKKAQQAKARTKRANALRRGLDPQTALEQEVRRALSYHPGRGPKGSGTYEECFRILCSLNEEFGPEKAIEIAEEWSPSFEQDEDWDVEKKYAASPVQISMSARCSTYVESMAIHPKLASSTPRGR